MRYLIFLVILSACGGPQKTKLRLAPLLPGHERSQHEAKSSGMMITSQGTVSSQAGLEMFKLGGNIIDAAVAVSFAISVERPQSTGIGGGGFLIYFEKRTGRTHVFDFREVAPYKGHPKMFLKADGSVDPMKSIYGPYAVAVPGLVRGLWDIHRRFGRLPWNKTLEPAIRLAEEGLAVYPHLVDAIKEESPRLKADPDAAKIFFNEKGEVPAVGYMLKQTDLAQTLRDIAKKGVNGFYQGRIAKSIVETVKKDGGLMSLKDLSDYRSKERKAVQGSYHGYKIISMPPPSSGGTHVVEILNLLEQQNLAQYGAQDPESIHRIATAMQISFADRAKYMGDPDFNPIPSDKLSSKSYAQSMQKYFTSKAVASSEFPLAKLPDGATETTHFTLADKDENIVVSTQTINGWFGSGLVARGTGIVLNNEMDDFAQAVGASNLFGAIGGDKNLVQPRKRPLSSMSPTIVLKDNKPFLALGTPSGTRIISCVTQTILNVLEFRLPLYEAVAATRIHHQWQPEELRVESPFLADSTMSALKAKGHKVDRQKLGCQIQAIQRVGEQWVGVSDPRGEGLAVGE
ncbi:MAG: gamma-glutamyltransferase [Bacteriovoracaceae bacterium]|nr:gamma-glutamyltransferase [Bacteriovoracaceae bacterium]